MRQRPRSIANGGSCVGRAAIVLIVGVVLWSACGSNSEEKAGSVLSSLGGDVGLATGNDPARAARVQAILDGSVVGRSPALDRIRVWADSGAMRPAGETVSRTEPELTWADTGAAIYRVSIENELGMTELESPRLAQTRWKVSKSLRRGGSYSWRLIADGKPAGEAAFSVLKQSDVRFWSITARYYGDRPSLLGAIAQDLGLLSEAQLLYERAEGGEVLLRNLETIRSR